MKIANLHGRAVLLTDNGAHDIATESNGRFGPDPMSVYRDWASFAEWAGSATLTAGTPYSDDDLGVPVPKPSQVFAIGLNYRDHADEAGIPIPENIIVFTKFASCLAAPNATVRLSSESVDYETELVVVIGRETYDISAEDAWDAVAGVAVGQDYSDRAVQLRGPAPQFSLGKSFPGFGPFGPAVVTVESLSHRDALGIRASLQRADGTHVPLQDGNTRDMVFSVAETIAELSKVVTLFPGDLIFTGTPAGVGAPRGIFLRPGDVLSSEIDGVGSIRNRFAA